MPEDSGKEPTEKQQQARFEKCVPKDKERTRRVRPKTPQDLVNFLMSFGSYNVFLTGARLRRKFPQLSISVERINKFMETSEFRDAVRQQIPDSTRQQNEGRYETVLQQYYEGQMQLKRDGVPCPDAKAITIFGQISGRYDPMEKIGVYDGHKMDAEKQKQVNEEVVSALLNKIKREEQAKKEGGGAGNGK